MNSERIEEIQKQCAYPESQSVFNALHQVWNEVGQEYQAELAEKNARIALLHHHLNDAMEKLAILDIDDTAEAIRSVLNESPHQSLAHIQAEAVDAFAKWYCSTRTSGNFMVLTATKEYASQLRQQADKG